MHLNARGKREPDDTFLVLMNASAEDVAFRLPDNVAGPAWRMLVNTSVDDEAPGQTLALGAESVVKGRSMQVFVMDAATAAGRT